MSHTSTPIASKPPEAQPAPPLLFTVRTSKKWVLPPRPKPGRKPERRGKKGGSVASAPAACSVPPPAPVGATAGLPAGPPVPIAPARTVNPRLILGGEAVNAPLHQAIRSVHEENLALKHELVKLVNDFNLLKHELEEEGGGEPMSRKRSHDLVEEPMEESPSPHGLILIEESLCDYLNLSDAEGEDMPSLTSTPTTTNTTENAPGSYAIPIFTPMEDVEGSLGFTFFDIAKESRESTVGIEGDGWFVELA